MGRTKIEFSEKTMGEINAIIDSIDAACADAVMNGIERQRILECQERVLELRKTIKEHAIITTYRPDYGRKW